MGVVENRTNIWNKVRPIMKVMCCITKVVSTRYAKKKLEKLRFKTGWVNMAWRYVFLNRIGTTFVGDGYRIIQPNVCIYNPDKLTLGERVTINDNSYLECSGGIEIGSDVMIGHGVSILSNSHAFNEIDIPMNMQGETFDKVIIESNVWIGAKSTILKGVTVGEGAIIGAHSFVNKDVKPYEVVGGTPIHHIRFRGDNL